MCVGSMFVRAAFKGPITFEQYLSSISAVYGSDNLEAIANFYR